MSAEPKPETPRTKPDRAAIAMAAAKRRSASAAEIAVMSGRSITETLAQRMACLTRARLAREVLSKNHDGASDSHPRHRPGPPPHRLGPDRLRGQPADLPGLRLGRDKREARAGRTAGGDP